MQNGLAIIHSNHLETLAEAAFTWCSRSPLAPLENELFLVQSNGMADWLKLKLAQFQGVSAAIDFPMPASYLWRLYRTVLSDDLSFQSPFDKGSLQWRIFSYLPELLEQEEFARPKQFLMDEKQVIDQQKLFQLSQKLADLFDQYQQYRGDWLLDWQQNKTVDLLQEKSQSFAQDEAWQMRLWQLLLERISQEELSRAQLHNDFKQALANNKDKMPRRLVVFGVNSLSEQIFDALCALTPYCQILMLVLNPSQVYWQDKSKEEAINHPLLDSWGDRGRDFTRLLSDFYERLSPQYQQNIQEVQVYLDAEDQALTRPGSILFSLQKALQDNLPLSPNDEDKLPLPSNPGLAFYPAFSRQREVEVLHDQLLALFQNNQNLSYHDVIVMMPNVEQYAAAIHAVFGRYSYQDKRYLHYSISDRNLLIDNPLFAALDYILALPDKRFLQSEIFFLLEQEAIRKAFSLNEEEVQQAKLWVEQSQIRWGFDQQHKAEILQAPEAEDWRNNTWQQGLDRLLAGYMAGSAAVWGEQEDTAVCNGIALDEVSANQGLVLGNFIRFIDMLYSTRQRLQECYVAFSDTDESESWQTVFSRIISDFFQPQTAHDEDVLRLLEQALGTWRENMQLAEFNQSLSLSLARKAWLEQVKQKGLSQRLSFNGIMFCTLMPMRALPFKHVFLLGMNDGDYPREQIAPDFDLMQYAFRTGDRDRRSDDQYLFLEALLSVRDSLSISWVGKDISDSSVKEPSTLVSQLRDYIDHIYYSNEEGKLASDSLTFEYPLAAFSPSYFDVNTPFTRTYANEWWPLFSVEKKPINKGKIDVNLKQLENLSIHHLAQLLKQPCSVFFRYGLGVYYPEFEVLSDEEPLENNNLVKWKIRNEALHNSALNIAALKRSGEFQAGFYTDKTFASELQTAANIQQRFEDEIGEAKPLEERIYRVSLYCEKLGFHCELNGVLPHLWQSQGKVLLADKTATRIGENKAWRLDKVAEFWLWHLIACSQSWVEESCLIGLNTTLKLKILSPEDAHYLLNQIFSTYLSALQQALPLAPLSAASYLQGLAKGMDDNALFNAVKNSFITSKYKQGDDKNAYIKAAFSDFNEYWQDDNGREFKRLAETLYQPIYDYGIAFKKGAKNND